METLPPAWAGPGRGGTRPHRPTAPSAPSEPHASSSPSRLLAARVPRQAEAPGAAKLPGWCRLTAGPGCVGTPPGFWPLSARQARPRAYLTVVLLLGTSSCSVRSRWRGRRGRLGTPQSRTSWAAGPRCPGPLGAAHLCPELPVPCVSLHLAVALGHRLPVRAEPPLGPGCARRPPGTGQRWTGPFHSGAGPLLGGPPPKSPAGSAS